MESHARIPLLLLFVVFRMVFLLFVIYVANCNCATSRMHSKELGPAGDGDGDGCIADGPARARARVRAGARVDC